MTRRSAFTIIELAIAVTVISALAALVTINFTESRARGRDANRRESVSAYGGALEQWKAKTGSYFVTAGTGCTATLPGPDNGYMTGSGANCVGFNGSGAGGITRKNTLHYPNQSSSIADALVAAGYLTEVRTDPSLANDTATLRLVPHPSDFILTLCKSDGFAANSPESATEYALYAQVERPGDRLEAEPTGQCGHEQSPGGGWDTLTALLP